MVLGYENEQGPTWESVAIKCFLSALDDPHLVIEIRKQRPATLDAAYQEALLLDGYYRTTPNERSDLTKERSETRLGRLGLTRSTTDKRETGSAICWRRKSQLRSKYSRC